MEARDGGLLNMGRRPPVSGVRWNRVAAATVQMVRTVV
jgi:hypothetical protein